MTKRNKIYFFSIAALLLLGIICAFLYLSFGMLGSKNKLYNAAFSYYLCTKDQLYEDACNDKYANLQASKLQAELDGIDSKKISRIVEISNFKANPKLSRSPYAIIKKSLKQFPWFIDPQMENFFMYDKNLCQSFMDVYKPFYRIIGWEVNYYKQKTYIAVVKENECPDKTYLYVNNNGEFPVITADQFKNLNDGYYWLRRPSKYSDLPAHVIYVVDSKNFSWKDLENLGNENNTGNNINSNLTAKDGSASVPLTENVDVSDIQKLGTFGNNNIELYRGKRSCFVSIIGENNNGEKSTILWNPKYDSWVIMYPGISTSIDAVKFSRINQENFKNEVSTDYIFVLNGSSYDTKGVYLNGSLVKVSNMPIDALKSKLLKTNTVVYKLKTSQDGEGFSFKVNGLDKALVVYDASCSDFE